ncbi:hypothetical protein F4819DRAFT_460229 [Hypoxylon fuscum]|nr:hypothetical protein F4819DRAFT_460229 [Hypoxylon fuscum]
MASDLLPTEVSESAFLAAIIVQLVVTGLFVAVRVVANYGYSKRLFIDDWVALFALILLIVVAALYYTMRITLNAPGTPLDFIARELSAVDCLAAFGTYFAKVPILLLYLRLFGVHKWLRIISHIMLIVPLLLFTASAIYAIVVCSPERKVVDANFIAQCFARSLPLGVWNGVVAVGSDIVIFILPIPIIIKLNIPLHKKIGLGIVFLAGILAIIASAVSLYYKSTSLAGVPTNMTGSMLGQTIENSIAIIVGCVPSIRSFWANQILSHPLFSKLQSALSSRRSSRSRKSSSLRKDSEASIVNISNSTYTYPDLNFQVAPHDEQGKSHI